MRIIGMTSGQKWRLNGLLLVFLFLISFNGLSKDLTKDSLKIEAFLSIDSDEYTTLKQRRKFYKKADRLLTNYGYEVRWLNVAFKTVRVLELAHSKFGGAFANTNAEIREFIQKGNQMILDDMLPKVRDLWLSGRVLKGDKAMLWDAQMLADEQDLIDPIYEGLTKISQDILDKNLKGCASRHLLRNPDFYGYVTVQEDRWSFGMRKMKYDVKPEMMPEPNGDWQDVKLNIPGKRKK